MRGVITGKDVVHHAPLIWREFGAVCLWRCLWHCVIGRRSTFLDIVWEQKK